MVKNRTFNLTIPLVNTINKFENRSEFIRKALTWLVEQEENREIEEEEESVSDGGITAQIGEKLNECIENLCKNNGTPRRFLSVSELARHGIREYLLYSNEAWIENEPIEPEPEPVEEIDPVDKYLKENGLKIIREA